MRLESVSVVWSDGAHNACTSIVEHGNKFFCAFRHASSHASFDGEIHILASSDLKSWRPYDVISRDGDDRDPQFFKFEGRLGIVFFTRRSEASPDTMAPAFSNISYYDDGLGRFSPPRVVSSHERFWRVAAFDGRLYACGHHGAPNWGAELFVSSDGRRFEKASSIREGENTNETAPLFMPDGTLHAIVRREGDSSLLATAAPPYSKWEFSDLGLVMQGVHLFEFNGKTFVAGRVLLAPVRHEHPYLLCENPKTCVMELDLKKRKVKPETMLLLPSAGDNSYCDTVVVDDELYMSYYSPHGCEPREGGHGEGPANIYQASLNAIS